MLINVPYCKHGHKRKITSSGRTYCPECNRKYVVENREVVRNHKSKWNSENPEKAKESRKLSQERNKHKRKIWEHENREERSIKLKEYKLKRDPLWYTWMSMNYRCHNPRHKHFELWGGKGVSVYEPWRMILKDRCQSTFDENAKRFQLFAKYIRENLGDRPEGLSLDRYPDYRGNYEPGNLRWATAKEQADNRRTSLFNRMNVNENIIADGNNGLTLKEISDNSGINLDVVKDRWARYTELDLITNERKLLGRRHEYKGNFYSMYELAIISGLPYSYISHRIHGLKWSVVKTIETPAKH